ncbi:hypothetical protein D3C80_1755420 [compost metagenome]
MRPLPKRSHGAQINVFCHGHSVESYPKKTFVQSSNNVPGRLLDVCKRDVVILPCVPDMTAPLLNEIRVAACEVSNHVGRF